ncbi:MAG: CAP domain-containing protein [Actinomycetota bacterium]
MRRHLPGGPALLVVAIVATLLGAPLSASGLSADAQRLLTLINQARSEAGLGAVAVDAAATSIAQTHATEMAAAGGIYHTSLSTVIGDAAGAGQNVGRGPTVDDVHQAFLADAVHRAILLKSTFTHVGIGLAPYGDGVMVVEDFLAKTGTATTAPTPSAPPAPAAPPAAAAQPQSPATPATAIAPERARAAAPRPAPSPMEAPAAAAEPAPPEPPPPPPPPPTQRLDRLMYERMIRWEQLEAPTAR